jgi:hypothetical protein
MKAKERNANDETPLERRLIEVAVLEEVADQVRRADISRMNMKIIQCALSDFVDLTGDQLSDEDEWQLNLMVLQLRHHGDDLEGAIRKATECLSNNRR